MGVRPVFNRPVHRRLIESDPLGPSGTAPLHTSALDRDEEMDGAVPDAHLPAPGPQSRTTGIEVCRAAAARTPVKLQIRPRDLHADASRQTAICFPPAPHGVATGDGANQLVAITRDLDAHVQEGKPLAAVQVADRRLREGTLPKLTEEYRVRASITDDTRTEHFK